MAQLPSTGVIAVTFTDKNDNSFEGLYIAKENMFFIGFAESGSFRFAFEIKSWKKISKKECKKRGIDNLLENE
jgi:hypothetical protein